MEYLIFALIALGLIAALLDKIFKAKRGEDIIRTAPDCATCSGLDESCEQVCTMEAATKPIVYYDDEELDLYKGRPSNAYNDAEIEQFSNVLYTLKPHEVRPWGRSLTLRGINLPDQIKDEFIAMA